MSRESVVRFADLIESQRGETDPITGEWTSKPFTEIERAKLYVDLEHIGRTVKSMAEEHPKLFKNLMKGESYE